MRKRALSLILCVVMLVSLFPAVYAEEEVDAGEELDFGEITVDDGIVVVEPEEPAADDAVLPDAGAGVPDGPSENDGSAEEPDEAAPADVGDDGETPADTTDGTPEESPVRVVFVCEPEETEITVYDPEVLDEYGEPVVIEPEEDESFLLLPGKYCYDAAAEGYVSLEEEEFTVEAAEENALPQEIRVTLEAAPAGTDDETDDGAALGDDGTTDADTATDVADDDGDDAIPAADDTPDTDDNGEDNETPDADTSDDADDETPDADTSDDADDETPDADETDGEDGEDGEEPAEDEEDTAQNAADGKRGVRFVTQPETAEITVYDPTARDELDKPVVIEPEEDGSYRLLPGTYGYDAWAEGYTGVYMAELTVEPGTDGESLEIQVTLEPEATVDAFVDYASRSVLKSGSCGSSARYTLYSDGELVISGSGAVNDYAFKNNTQVKKLTIKSGITSVGYECFYKCTNMSSATIPGSLTKIGNWAFESCTGLKTVIFEGKAPTTISSYSFYRVTATVLFNSNYSGWPASKRGDYGGTLTWVDQADPVAAFVTRAYQQILGREPDGKGLTDWVNALRSGSVTGATLVNGFVTSQEFINRKLTNAKVVEILYKVMLDRSPDSAGKANWTNYLDNGLSYSFIVNGFAGSQEFRKICSRYGITPGSLGIGEYRDMNPNVTFFVSRCYKLILNRAPDAAGLNNWTYLLLTGNQTGATVVNGFVRSNEFTKRGLSNAKVVEILYNVMLNRAPDSSGKAFWQAFLTDGVSYSFIVNGFAGSQEFINLCASYGIQAGSLVLTETRDRCGHLYSATAQGNKVTLNWMAGVNPTSYTIRYGYSKNNLSGYVSGIPGNARSYTITGLQKNTTYYFAISTVVGQSTIASSRVISVKTGNYDGVADYRALLIAETSCPGQTPLPEMRYDIDHLTAVLASVNGGKFRTKSYINQSSGSILSLIPSTFAGADEDDVSLFFITTHGDSSSGANRNAGALCTSGNYGEMLYLDDLSNALAAIPGWIVVFVHSCGSGAGVYPYTAGGEAMTDADFDAFSDEVISAFAAVDRDMTLLQETTYFNEEGEAVRTEEIPYEPETEDEFLSYVGEWKRPGKFQVLVSSSFQENSWSWDPSDGAYGSTLGYGIYCGIGTSGRMQADTNGNRWTTLQELYVYCYNTIVKWTNGRQHPRVYPANSDFVIFYR